MAGITIKEIAQKAGVSIGTVDRVLHNRGEVSDKTKQTVLSVCKEFGYEKNLIGKALEMQKKKRTVAVVINGREKNSFSKMVHDGIEAKGKEISDYNICFEYYDLCHSSVEEEEAILEELLDKEIHGLIVKPMDDLRIVNLLQRMNEKNIPLVFCTSDLSGVERVAFVGQDHFNDGRTMADMAHLLTKAKMKILIAVSSFETLARRTRLQGFESWLKDKKIDYEIREICHLPKNHDDIKKTLFDSLSRNKDTNCLYINTTDITAVLEAVDEAEYCGKAFSFGEKNKVEDYLLSNKLSFVIEEYPFRQGYESAEVMFNYLMNGICPNDKDYIFKGNILIEANL